MRLLSTRHAPYCWHGIRVRKAAGPWRTSSRAAQPSGRLPISIERRVEENPAFGSYYPNVFLFQDSPLRRISYDEGVFVGYHGHDRNGTEPMYPFGYGLSYTTFEYGDLELTPAGDGWRSLFFRKEYGETCRYGNATGLCRRRAASVPSD